MKTSVTAKAKNTSSERKLYGNVPGSQMMDGTAIVGIRRRKWTVTMLQRKARMQECARCSFIKILGELVIMT